MANHNRGVRLPGEALAAADVRALLAACGRGATGIRNRALLVVLWRAGLRTAEALALRPSDVDAPILDRIWPAAKQRNVDVTLYFDAPGPRRSAAPPAKGPPGGPGSGSRGRTPRAASGKSQLP